MINFEDGKYKWVYGISLYKNPTVFFLVWKIFFFIVTGIFAFVMIVDAAGGDGFFPDKFLSNLKIYGIFVAGMTALVLLGCLIYAAMMGGKYVVEFEMDDKGVLHSQISAQAEKAKKLGMLAAAAGARSGRFGAASAGIAAQRTQMYSEFSKVRKVKAYPRRHLIKVNGRLEHNQVYAAPEDFEFVLEFIRSHCPGIK